MNRDIPKEFWKWVENYRDYISLKKRGKRVFISDDYGKPRFIHKKLTDEELKEYSKKYNNFDLFKTKKITDKISN